MGAKRQLELSGPGKTFDLGCVQELRGLEEPEVIPTGSSTPCTEKEAQVPSLT